MRGGYLDDRYINGAKVDNPYFFVHWSAVDIFVYFSHHFITLPPCSWISAAHMNGVKILGTLITEWDDGKTICNEILSDEASVHHWCSQLVGLAVYHNFDGWLLNIENPLEPSQIVLMKQFVKCLTEMMHSQVDGSQVIWYDSVTKNGQLNWQSSLNELNNVFFLNCDGIFLNYVWNDKELKEASDYAFERKKDVFVGIDVFGRGCYGGGGFATDEAMKKALDFGFSIAIFAPGWVYECLDVNDFAQNQFSFWNTLHHLIPPRSVEELPYHSSFCPGFGKKMFREGKVISNEPWFNLNLQHPQPLYYPQSEDNTVSICASDAFNGGGCLSLSLAALENKAFTEFRILTASFFLEDTCTISYTYKPQVENLCVSLELDMRCEEKVYRLRLNGNDVPEDDDKVNCLLASSVKEIPSIGPSVSENAALCGNWIKRTYILKSDQFMNHFIESISAVLHCRRGHENRTLSALIGELSILPLQPKYGFTYSHLTCTSAADNPNLLEVECVLQWRHDPAVLCYDLYRHVENEETQYIATTSQDRYRIKLSVTRSNEIRLRLCPQTEESDARSSSTLRLPLPHCVV